jgi:hypothetical protein
MTTKDVGADFVRLGFSIDQHFPGYVDAYFGPPAISQSVRDQGKASWADLEALADELHHLVAEEPLLEGPRRDHWLGEISAMRTTIRILRGEALSIVEEVQRLYGVTPVWIDEAVFCDAQDALGDILPGSGPTSQRVREYRERMRVPLQAIGPAVTKLAAQLRDRTRLRFPLPPHEACEFEFVQDKPWMAYNWYGGAGSSRIQVNVDSRIHVHQLPGMVAHEAYPGHHTECAIKEEGLYRAKGWFEYSIWLSNSPSALVSEGIAMNALEAITERQEAVQILRDLLDLIGLPPDEAPRVYEFERAGRPLGKVAGNQVLLLYGEAAPDEEVIAYGLRHAMTTDEEERQAMRFYKDPISRSYAFNYTIGRDLVESYLRASADKMLAFAHLLSSPMTPGEMVSASRG